MAKSDQRPCTEYLYSFPVNYWRPGMSAEEAQTKFSTDIATYRGWQRKNFRYAKQFDLTTIDEVVAWMFGQGVKARVVGLTVLTNDVKAYRLMMERWGQ